MVTTCLEMEGIKLSVLDVITQNFSKFESNTYIHKIFYTGEHSFLEEAEKVLSELFTSVIEHINGEYCNAEVSGFILIYQKYFIAIIEGSEETISWQIKQFIFESPEKHKFGRCKILIIHHNMNERQFVGASHLFKIPPVLAAALSQDKAMEYYTQIMETILDKLDKIFTQLYRKKSITSSTENYLNTDITLDCFPEYALLEFILTSTYSFDLREYAYMSETLKDYQYSFEKCWPTPYDFTPIVNYERELADIFVEPLPKSVYDVEEEEEEEEVVEGGEEREKGEENAEEEG